MRLWFVSKKYHEFCSGCLQTIAVTGQAASAEPRLPKVQFQGHQNCSPKAADLSSALSLGIDLQVDVQQDDFGQAVLERLLNPFLSTS